MDQGERPVGDRPGDAFGDRHELVVGFAGEGEHRHVQLDEALPQWHLHAGTGEAQARGQPGCGVASTIGAFRVIELEPVEQRLREPLVEERIEADLEDVLREAFVGRPPCCSFVVVRRSRVWR